MIGATIPSPDHGVWYLGPLPLRAYAMCIVLGIFLAVWLTDRRWRARGGGADTVERVALWTVPAGIVGARLYHVVTDHQLYFGPGRNPIEALYIWHGGLSIFGAVMGGAIGAWWGCRRAGVRLAPFADAVAPGLVLAQAVGRWGNYFNQELFGRPTDLPWGLEIDPAHRPEGYEHATTFHPTFLYESLWNLGVGFALLWAERRFNLGHGRVFWLYAVLYLTGRFWIEALRIDPATHVDGIRINSYVTAGLWLLAVAMSIYLARTRPGREEQLTR